MKHTVFIAGSTGYMGRNLVAALNAREHQVLALARPGSERKLPSGCKIVAGDPLRPESFINHVKPADTWIHLVGVPHPSPRKAHLFEAIDLESVRAAVKIALESGIQHFVYVSVAHPAPVMKAYIDVRVRCEEVLRSSGIKATILRPWYVLGPGHRWPYLLKPVYGLLRRLPATAEPATRLGLVTLDQMITAIVHCVEMPAVAVRLLEVPQIQSFGR